MQSSKKMCKQKNKIGKNQLKTDLDLTLLAIPGIILLIIFKYLPLGGLVIAFKNYTYAKGIWGSEWAGLENFKFFFTSQDAFRITRNTVGYGAVFLILGIVTQVGLALLLFEVRSKKALKVYQTSMILPNFLSWVIVGYITYVFLNPKGGVFNNLLQSFGLMGIDWYTEPKYWPFILPIVNVWKGIGMGSLIYYASLMGIDTEIFEAAQIDGANKIQQIIHISIPSLSAVMCTMLIMGIGNIVRGDFGLFYQIPRDVGLLYPTTDIIDTYVFRGVRNGSFAISSAVGFFQSVVGFIMVLITNKIVTMINSDNAMF